MSTLTAPDKRGQPKAVKDPLKKRRPAAGGRTPPHNPETGITAHPPPRHSNP